jgi:NADPH-dependent 2,4-dienoyl-CoA reductase/sulfur reductase-like enzyme
MITRDVDVAIVGSGPAGLGAAIKAKESGADKVVILERSEELGGLLHQCVHNGFGLLYFNEDLTGPEFAHRLIEKVNDLGIEYNLRTMVIKLSSDRIIKAVNPKEGLVKLNCEAIVLAMGCRERTYHNIGVMGTRPAGVLTAGVAQRYINVEGYIPGNEVVILGSGDIGMIMARRLTLEGAKVIAVVEILPYCGGLKRNEVQCLHDFDIPLYLSHTVNEIHGRNRVEAVTVCEVDEKWNSIRGTERVIDCDTLLLSVGLIPENELSLQAGIEIDPITGGPLTNNRMETSVPGIFAGGNVVTVYDLVDYVVRSSEIAGENAARFIGERPELKKPIKVKAGKNIRVVSPQTIDPESDRDIDVYIRVAKPQKKVRILAADGEIFKKTYMMVTPSEMIVVKVPASKLKDYEEIEIKCQEM